LYVDYDGIGPSVKPMKTLFTVLTVIGTALVSCTCLAGSQQSSTDPGGNPVAACPVSITNINPTGSDSMGGGFMKGMGGGDAHSNDGRMFVLKVKNTSGKDIKGMKFQAAYFDATEDLSDIPVSWEWTDPLKADAEKSFRWQNLWREESKVGWRVRLTKVLYGDGSKWEAVKGQTCSGEFWRDKHHKS
jgi:hypothetical protein